MSAAMVEHCCRHDWANERKDLEQELTLVLWRIPSALPGRAEANRRVVCCLGLIPESTNAFSIKKRLFN